MKIPNFDRLRSNQDFHSKSYAQSIHPDPRFYKYQWWVFWKNSACDGRQFLTSEYSLGTCAAMALIDDLFFKRESHWIYNKQIPRNEPGITPFNVNSVKWKNIVFTPSFDQDCDPLWTCHK